MPHVSMLKGRGKFHHYLFTVLCKFHVQFQGFLLDSKLTEFPLGYIPEFIIYAKSRYSFCELKVKERSARQKIRQPLCKVVVLTSLSSYRGWCLALTSI